MKQEVRTMLEDMYELFSRKFNDSVRAWDSLLEFLAVDNNASLIHELDHGFEWLFADKKLLPAVLDAYDAKLLRSDFNDHLGEMYLEKIVSKTEAQKKGLFLTPVQVADALAKMTMEESLKNPTVLDPAVGTGRLLMAAYKVSPQAHLFGVDSDLRALRIATTNFFIHDIPGYLLHADSLLHETDISTEDGRYNWQFANSWYSCMDKLKPVTQHQDNHTQLKLWQEQKPS